MSVWRHWGKTVGVQSGWRCESHPHICSPQCTLLVTDLSVCNVFPQDGSSTCRGASPSGDGGSADARHDLLLPPLLLVLLHPRCKNRTPSPYPTHSATCSRLLGVRARGRVPLHSVFLRAPGAANLHRPGAWCPSLRLCLFPIVVVDQALRNVRWQDPLL